MTNRTRKIVLRVPVTPEERELIRQKMALLHTRNFSAYARKMLIDGYVVHIDTTDIRAQTAELQKIGVNVNQIARRLNSMGPLYTQDVADIKRWAKPTPRKPSSNASKGGSWSGSPKKTAKFRCGLIWRTASRPSSPQGMRSGQNSTI